MRTPLLLLPLLGLALTACPSKPKPEEGAGSSAGAGLVSVTSAGISLGNERLGDAPGDALAKVDPLFRRLKEQREEWKTAHPADAFPGVIVIELGPELSCQASMSVYMTAMFAGYPNITLKQGALVLDIPAAVPKPPSLEAPSPSAPRQAFPPATPARGKARVAIVREGMVTVVGGLTQDEVREAMKPMLETLKACYETGTINNPNLQGRVSVGSRATMPKRLQLHRPLPGAPSPSLLSARALPVMAWQERIP